MNNLIEKIVERIKEQRDYHEQYAGKSDVDSGFYRAYNETLFIIQEEAKAYNEEVCEWKWVDNGKFIQNPHTHRKFSHEPSMRNVYCNTCGKKISIVNWLKAEREG